MKSFRVTLLMAQALFLAACSPRNKPPLPSPDGAFTLHTTIEQSRRDPTIYGCVIIEIQDKASKVLHRENTGASDFQRWDIQWTSKDELRLTSSDIGTCFWTRQPDATWKKEWAVARSQERR